MKAKRSTKGANHLTTAITFRLSESDSAQLKEEADRRGFTGVSAFVRALALSSYMSPNETTLVLENGAALGTYSRRTAEAGHG